MRFGYEMVGAETKNFFYICALRNPITKHISHLLQLVGLFSIWMNGDFLRAEPLTIEVPRLGETEEGIKSIMNDSRFQVRGTDAIFSRFPGVSFTSLSGEGGTGFLKVDTAGSRSTTIELEGLPISDPSSIGGETDVNLLKGLLTETFPSELDLQRGEVMEAGSMAEGGIITISLPKINKKPGSHLMTTAGTRGYAKVDVSAHKGGVRIFGGLERGDGQPKLYGDPGFRTTQNFDSYTGGIQTFHQDHQGRSLQTLVYGVKGRNNGSSLNDTMHHRDFGLAFAQVSLPNLSLPSTFSVMAHGGHRWEEGSYSNRSHVFQGQWKGINKRTWGRMELILGGAYEAGQTAAFSKTWGRGYVGFLPIFQFTKIWALGIGGRLEQVGSFFVPATEIFVQSKTPKNFLKLSLSWAKRAPSFDQRYGSSSWQLPNPELKSMSSVRLELDARKYFSPFWVGIRAFGTRAYNDIVGIKIGHKWQSQNHVRTQGQGIEFYTYAAWKGWSGYVTHTMMSTYDVRTKTPLAGIPKYKTLFGLTHTSDWGEWTLSPFAEFALFGPQLLRPGGRVRGGYPILRAGVSFAKPGLDFFMRVENILNRREELTEQAASFGNFTQGRVGFIGMSVEF